MFVLATDSDDRYYTKLQFITHSLGLNKEHFMFMFSFGGNKRVI
jgi:hypothetical protein